MKGNGEKGGRGEWFEDGIRLGETPREEGGGVVLASCSDCCSLVLLLYPLGTSREQDVHTRRMLSFLWLCVCDVRIGREHQLWRWLVRSLALFSFFFLEKAVPCHTQGFSLLAFEFMA